MAYLRHYLNGSVVTIYEIKDTLHIGRHPDCNITIDDPTVSGKHAELSVEPSVCLLKDMGSTNGVRINGDKITQTSIEPGTLFSIGTHEFEYLLEIPSDLDKTLKIKKSWIPGVYFTE
ncbi:MAG: FHA domain-containing protein [Agarilytica sp.]